MVFGHNSNVKVGETVYHVQTEDRGTSHAVIDTMVYHSGRVLHRRANSYADLLPLDSAREVALRERVSTQHQTVLDELRSGALKLAQPVAPAVASKPAPVANAASLPFAGAAPDGLVLRLLNAKDWLTGRRATLQVRRGSLIARLPWVKCQACNRDTEADPRRRSRSRRLRPSPPAAGCR